MSTWLTAFSLTGGHYIRRFNIFTGTWGELCNVKSFIPDLLESRFLALDSSNFLLLNQNGTGLKCPLCVFVEMYVLHTDGDIYQAYVLPKMQRDRFNAGLLYFKGSVYAFGGNGYPGRVDIDGPIDEEMAHSAEALSVNSTAIWRTLACTMRHQKLSLVPCLYLNKAYLYSYSANVITGHVLRNCAGGSSHRELGVATTAFIVDGNFIVIAMNVYVLFDLKAENKSPTDVFYAKNAVSECVRRYTIRRMTF